MQTYENHGDVKFVKLDDEPEWEAKRLGALADVLRENHMPQDMINMVLASRTGLPMKSVDPMSPAFAWADESGLENEPERPQCTASSSQLKETARTLREEGISRGGIHAALLSACGITFTAQDLRSVQMLGLSL